jgi:hypothetical protein
MNYFLPSIVSVSWVGPRAGQDVVAKKKFPVFTGNRNAVIQRVAGYFD